MLPYTQNIYHLLVSWSVVTAAVSPTPDEPRPVVVIALGAACSTYRNSCDLAVLGSPINNMLMSLQQQDTIAEAHRKLGTKYSLFQSKQKSPDYRGVLISFMDTYCNGTTTNCPYYKGVLISDCPR